jgi:fucose 4-O-acetylase-like acetyltransferase
VEQKHYDWVDYAKGIGIILVVYGHVARGVYNAGMIENQELFTLVDSILYSFHMPLFFFLSGLFFISSITKRGEGGLIISKVDTIIYPYIIWSLIQGGVEYSLDGVTNFSTTIQDIYSLFWLPHDQFWFLYALFLVFLAYTILYRFIANVFVLFFISVLMYLFQDLLQSPWGIMNSIYKFGVYFCGGVLFSKYIGVLLKNTNFWWLGTAFILFIGSQWFYHMYLDLDYLSHNGLLLLTVGLIAIATVVIFSSVLAKINFNVIKKIGSYSLEIYLVHVLFGSGFRIIMQKLFGFESSGFHLLFGTMVGIFVSILFVWAAKRFGLSFLFYIPKKYQAYTVNK